MKLIGLTGGIASGKSTAGRLLRDAGVAVVDADVLARDAVAPGSAGLAAVVARFGAGVIGEDGNLDRKKLGSIVFGDDEARRALNAIVHPAVAQLAQERLGSIAARGDAVAVYEVPLLFENHLDAMFDAIILVAVSDATQVARAMARDGLDEAAVRARIASQMPLADKRARAHFVVDNDGDVVALAAALAAVWQTATGQVLDLVASASPGRAGHAKPTS